MKHGIVQLCLCVVIISCTRDERKEPVESYQERHRPQLHYSPKTAWMNDPNGMFFLNGTYHVYYQHYPDSTIWGPMHWGHASSRDLIHWDNHPIALYPDSLGYIFSGSAVVDSANTSGFGKDGKTPVVAIYTYHQMEKEKAGADDFQYQGIAYSLDEGMTWVKYEHNPVLKNQGIRDFRDPKVFWHQNSKNWIMTLAVKDHVEFWKSPDLKTWSKLSDFGLTIGSHAGVWECPDLIEVSVSGTNEKKWVLLLSINPGGPNGGSATQYFVGSFDGKNFVTESTDTLWVDHGPDNYAGVTFANTPGRTLFMGWLNNWAYADRIPTKTWRGALTLPRELSLTKLASGYRIKSTLAKETGSLTVAKTKDFPSGGLALISGTFEPSDVAFTLENGSGEYVRIGFDAAKNMFFVDRSKSGDTTFSEKFNGYLTAPRIATGDVAYDIVVDHSSMEVFFDNGLTVMTVQYFPSSPFSKLIVEGEDKVKRKSITELKSIWKK